MDNSFISDMNIFNNDLSFLIKLRDKPQILKIISAKHVEEISEEISIEDKRNDLIIWNAMYTREIVEYGILTKYLHPIYNKFYTLIPTINTIKELQELEVKMIDTYINLLINDMEVKDNFVINRILKHLHLNIESQISLKKIANDLNLSEGYISECFKKHMGITIMKYAKKIRIDRAKVLLVTTTTSILEISLILGFHDQSHFHKVFKSFTGLSPSEYRNNNFG
ncbi:AraC family transcriptional regulator [uncultured Clostridium sp.]|uniref:helix-turn-helix domain-containing protein n=1 Tax=uncultured Clostridium sp. TaxID=59620 RepID=UPI0028E4FA1E|nr:AraC family transcriptional regulator [uncultured Clostridium sp.]